MSDLPLLDYCFLLFETRSSPKHVGGLQIFELPDGASSDFVEDLVEQACQGKPNAPFDSKVHAPLIGMPQWLEDEHFDPENHIFHEAVPEPGTMDALLERIEEIHAEQLDRSQPLWEIYFFEGLAPRQFAMFFKVHHAYMDGVALSKLAMSSLSPSRKTRKPVAFWGKARHAEAAPRHGILESLLGTVAGAGKAAVVATRLSQLGLKHGLRLLHAGGKALPIPFSAPRTAFNEPLTSTRSIAVSQLSLRRVKSLAHKAGVTINDVLLCVCDRALRGYLDSHGGHTDKPLIAEMPISLRRATTNQGNQITIALMELGSDVSDPLEHLLEIHRHATSVKHEFTNISPESAEAYTLLMQSIAQIGETLGLDSTLPPLGNVVVSNLIGPNRRRYLRGAPLVGVYPISTIAPGLVINITVYSYAGVMYLGLVAGHHAIPDLSQVADDIEPALRELEVCTRSASNSRAASGQGRSRRKKH